MRTGDIGERDFLKSIQHLVGEIAGAKLGFDEDDYDVSASQELIRGYSQYCLKSGIPFIGGDLGSSSEVVLTGVAIGMAAPETIVTRSGTKEGDIIAVTDLFGLTSASMLKAIFVMMHLARRTSRRFTSDSCHHWLRMAQ